MAKRPARVAILMGSDSDLPVVEKCLKTLKDLDIPFEVRVLSAHRTPNLVERFVEEADAAGIQVFICAAGGAAHLAGAVVARTLRPVIGIPINSTPLLGLDALLATVQMPSPFAVATMAVGDAGAANAGFMAARILALSDPALLKRLEAHREQVVKGVIEKDSKVRTRSHN